MGRTSVELVLLLPTRRAAHHSLTGTHRSLIIPWPTSHSFSHDNKWVGLPFIRHLYWPPMLLDRWWNGMCEQTVQICNHKYFVSEHSPLINLGKDYKMNHEPNIRDNSCFEWPSKGIESDMFGAVLLCTISLLFGLTIGCRFSFS